MQRLLSLAVLGLTLSTTSLALASGGSGTEHRWFADYDQAVAAAKEEKKDLFVDFTGSDWCGWCIRLHEEVFQHDAFYDAISKDFVLVALDYPRGKEALAKVPNKARNDELNEKYGIQGYPTVLLMDVAGEVFGKTGYRPGGPDAYVTYVADLTKAGKALVAAAKELEQAYAAAEGDARTAVVRRGIDALTNAVEGAAGADVVARVVRRAFELDPENAAGLKLAAIQALMASGTAEGADLDVAEAMDPQNGTGLFEQALLQRRFGVVDAESASAFVDRLLAFAKLGKVHDKSAVAESVHPAIMWTKRKEMLDRPEDAKALFAFAETLGDVPQEIRDAMKE